jgi:hypothetical protein
MAGVSQQSLIKYKHRENPPPCGDDNLYPVKEFGDWIRSEQIYAAGRGNVYPHFPDLSRYPDRLLKAYKTPTNNAMPGMEPPVIEDQDTRYKRLRGDKLEMDIQERAKSLVKMDEMLLAISSMVSRVKTRFLAIPSQLALTLADMTDPSEIQDYLKSEFYVVIEELSNDPRDEIDFGDDDEIDMDEDA